MVRGVGASLLFASAAAGFGCKPASTFRGPYTIIGGDPRRVVPASDISQSEWTRARERLERLRAEIPHRPYVERVQIGMRDPRSGKFYQARGAVAVSPDNAARMVLVGPGGTTALDLWVTRDRFRFAIPAIKLEKRGGSDLSQAPGLPIGFLRWWFLSPLDGQLVLARSGEREAAFVLRDGPATVTLQTDGERFSAVRRENGRRERLEWFGRSLAPREGARGHYVESQWGLSVQVVVEEVLPDEPDPAAFFDPDDTGAAL
jgi:hypothetical protein